MEVERILFKSTIFLMFIRYTNAILFDTYLQVVSENDCNPKCLQGHTCILNRKTNKKSCTCPPNHYYDENFGCQMVITCPLCRHANPWGTTHTVPNTALPGQHKSGYQYSICKDGHTKDEMRTFCRRYNACERGANICPEHSTCIIDNKGHAVCNLDNGYRWHDNTEKIAVRIEYCGGHNKNKCIPPATCQEVNNANSNTLTVCSCPSEMYLTRNKRQCSKQQQFSDNKVYSISVKNRTEKFPENFKVFLDGCFDVQLDGKEGVVIYKSSDTVSSIKSIVNIPTDLKSIHFEMKFKTLNIFVENGNDMHPIFSIKFDHSDCKFIESIEGLEIGDDILRTESNMRDLHPTL